MITRRKIKRTLFNKNLRRKHRRHYRRSNNSFLIILLLVLLTFNLVAFIYLVNKGDISKDITVLDLVLDTLNLREIPIIEPEEGLIYEPDPEGYDHYSSYEEEIIVDLEEYENLIVVEEGNFNLGDIPEPINVGKINVDRSKEYILAYHTHTTESFLSSDGKYYNTDKNKNVVAIGEIISTVLNAQGHKVKHDITVHDLPSFNQSYSRSRNTINKSMEENPNLKILVDIHRDGRDKNSPNLDAFIEAGRIDIDGVSNATFAMVIGPDTPNYDEVLSMAKYIKAVSDVMYPGLCRSIIIKPVGKFNLNFSNHSVLLEVGSNWTTIEETKETGKKVGEILSVVFDQLINE